MRKNNRRRVRKRRANREKTKMKFSAVLVIITIAIALGYISARFLIIPILGYNTDESPINVSASKEDENGFALQFGIFSTKEAAQKLVDDLTQKGIAANIVEENEKYKVISPIIKTKDEALGKLNDIKDKDVEDVFITSF